MGYPQPLFARVSHPAAWIGAAIDLLDRSLNSGSPARRRAAGFLAVFFLLLPCFALGAALQIALLRLPGGFLLLAAISSALLAQRSLHSHVADVARALDVSVEDARLAVAKIVGRDVSRLDEAGVARAAIESLAENFSDGVVAPAFWMAWLGLPGALAYKAINTADSMIGHKTEHHIDFGFAAAKLDDLVNLPASRLAALLISCAAALSGLPSARNALRTAMFDAGKHHSPNAGWPEAAMAGALSARLGGPRTYGERAIIGATLGDGRRDLCAKDIWSALALYRRALAALWALTALTCAAGVLLGHF